MRAFVSFEEFERLGQFDRELLMRCDLVIDALDPQAKSYLPLHVWLYKGDWKRAVVALQLAGHVSRTQAAHLCSVMPPAAAIRECMAFYDRMNVALLASQANAVRLT